LKGGEEVVDFRVILVVWATRRTVRWVAFAWLVFNFEIELGENEGPTGLTPGERRSGHEVAKVAVVGKDLYRVSATFEVVSPVFEGLDNSKEFTVMHLIVPFGWDELAGVKGNRVPMELRLLRGGIAIDIRALLAKNASNCEGRSVCFEADLGFWVVIP